MEQMEALYRERVALMVCARACVSASQARLPTVRPYRLIDSSAFATDQDERVALGKALLDPAWMHGRRRISAYV